MSTLRVPEIGLRALKEYNETGTGTTLRMWLSGREGREYLRDLHGLLPPSLDVWRGVNGVVGDIFAAPFSRWDFLEDLHTTGHGGEVAWENDTAPDYRPPDDGEVVSYTTDENVAHYFAIGRIGLEFDMESYGVVLKRRIPREWVLYHHEYVDTVGMRFEDEAEVTALIGGL